MINKIDKVLRGNLIVEIPAKDISVGDVLYLQEDEEIPCDCVVLYSSNPNGICYIQVIQCSLFFIRQQILMVKPT